MYVWKLSFEKENVLVYMSLIWDRDMFELFYIWIMFQFFRQFCLLCMDIFFGQLDMYVLLVLKYLYI